MSGSWPCLALFLALLLFSAAPLATCSVGDPYKVLGVSRSATDAEVRAAYKKLALKFHPDKAGGDGAAAQERFIKIQQAYEAISDAEKRASYDRAGWRAHNSGGSQQQRQAQWDGGWFAWEATSFDLLLPSSTMALTASNIRSTVLFSQEPWLIQIYSEDCVPCRALSPTWEAFHKLVSAGVPSGQPAWLRMGRINWKHQRSLAAWATAHLTVDRLEGLPIVIGVPRTCARTDCFIKYKAHGATTMSSLQEWVADTLLRLPAVPNIQLSQLDVVRHSTHRGKVLGIVFSTASAPKGTLLLRRTAQQYSDMMHFVRVSLGVTNGSTSTGGGGAEEDGSSTGDASAAGQAVLQQWQAALRVRGPLNKGSVVLLRGPGVPPSVLDVKGVELEPHIREQGLMWQAIPALRLTTAHALGCLWPGLRGHVYRTTTSVRLCVVAMAADPAAQDSARRDMLRLQETLQRAAHHHHSDGAPRHVTAAGAALQAGQLQLAWIDAHVQRQFCAVHIAGQPAGVRAAVCGRDWLGWVTDAVVAVQAAGSGQWRQAWQRMRPPPPRAALVAFASHSFVTWDAAHRYSVFADPAGDADLWVGQAYADTTARNGGTLVAQRKGVRPPQLVPDDEPSAVGFIADRLVTGLRAVLHAMLAVAGPAQVRGAVLSPDVQNLLALVFTCFVTLAVQLAVRTTARAQGRSSDTGSRRG